MTPSRSRTRRSRPRRRTSAPSSVTTSRRRRRPRPAARHRGRHQGHHRHRRYADRDGLGDLSRLAAARGCACGDDAEAGGRHRHRQDHDHGVRLARSDPDAQSAQSRPYAGRLVLGLGGGRRCRHDPAGAGHPDRRLGDPARGLLRRRRDQAVVPDAADGRRQMLFVGARHGRPVRIARAEDLARGLLAITGRTEFDGIVPAKAPRIGVVRQEFAEAVEPAAEEGLQAAIKAARRPAPACRPSICPRR